MKSVNYHKSKTRRFNYQVFASLNGQLVIYDATLMGGMFNQTSVYALNSSEINPIVLRVKAGLKLSYHRYGLTYEQHYGSPEFDGAKEHLWGRISLDFKL